MPKSIFHVLALAAFAAGAASTAIGQGNSSGAAVEPSGKLEHLPQIDLVQVADGLSDPVGVVTPPDGTGRLFVLERQGRIRIIQDGALLDEPFMDISDDVLSAFLEQGLYDMAFHPDFAIN